MEIRATWRATLIHNNGGNMKCLNCGNSSFDRPVGKSSLEIWHCKECGNECAVHCNYIPDLSGMQMSDLFIGTAFINPGPDALKSLMKLKRVLAFAERFEPARLEAQYRAGKHEWDLGYFLDFEVAQASAMCQGAGVPVTFEIVRSPPYAISAG
jgi:ribosomal protein L37AE/L43A